MPRTRNSRARKNSEDLTDDEALRDELDAFHAEDRRIEDDDYRRRKEIEPEEILNVEGEEEPSAGEEDETSGDEFDSDDEDMRLTDNKWGRTRKDQYGTGYVDEDWGGMREEELEDADIEEEDALSRQKDIDKKLSALVLPEFDEDDEQQDEQQKQAVQEEFTVSNALKYNKKLKRLIETVSQKTDIFNVAVRPLLRVARRLPEGSPLREEFLHCYEIYNTFLLNAVFFLKLKSESFAEKNIVDEEVDSHPVLDTIKLYKMKTDEVDSYLGENSEEINEIVKAAEAGDKRFAEIHAAESIKAELGKTTTRSQRKAIKKKAKDATGLMEGNGTTTEEGDGQAEEDEEGGKRKASENIVSNKTKEAKQKKKGRIAKTRNRERVRAISKRVKSQIAPVRREIEKYGGESKGIRISTIKSTKLIA